MAKTDLEAVRERERLRETLHYLYAPQKQPSEQSKRIRGGGGGSNLTKPTVKWRTCETEMLFKKK